MYHQPTQPTHDDVLRLRAHRMPPEGPPSAAILDSWARSLQAGLDPAAPLAVPVVSAAELARRRAQAGDVRRLAQAELATLAQQIAGSNFLLAFADHDGVILDLIADNRFVASGSSAGIVAGSRWHESVCGTNGLGTALAIGAPVAVSGLAHHHLQLADITCTAAPVRDSQGRIVGVLDASSYYDSRQHHTHALVQMAATQIENGLLQHQMRHHTVVAVHPRSEYLGTLSAGLLALDGQGLLLACNARAAQMLAGLQAVPGTAFEALFGASFDSVLGALPPGAELRLRDPLGRLLAAQVRARPHRQAAPVHAPRAVSVTAPQAALIRAPQVMPAVVAQPARPPRLPAAAPTAPAPGFVADDPAVALACRQVQAAVRLGVSVLIQGETGSGKELLARHAHLLSGRRGVFVAVNCAALPDGLFEAELFGHVGGAFSGARRDGSIGLIASADGGTLLLDEVAELPLPMQAALLRFLDDGLVRPVGGTRARHIDVQLLAASATDLHGAAAARRFRDDLLYRLAVVPVHLPPLRARSDFAEAARAVLAAIDRDAHLTDAAVALLATHRWPGNFRELRSLLTRLLLALPPGAGGTWLDAPDVAALLAPALPAGQGVAAGPCGPDAQAAAAGPAASALQQAASLRVRQEFERCGGNVSRTSRNLGISRTTVYRHLRDHRRPDRPSGAD